MGWFVFPKGSIRFTETWRPRIFTSACCCRCGVSAAAACMVVVVFVRVGVDDSGMMVVLGIVVFVVFVVLVYGCGVEDEATNVVIAFCSQIFNGRNYFLLVVGAQKEFVQHHWYCESLPSILFIFLGGIASTGNLKNLKKETQTATRRCSFRRPCKEYAENNYFY